jgi:hypothetical protein
MPIGGGASLGDRDADGLLDCSRTANGSVRPSISSVAPKSTMSWSAAVDDVW